MTTAFNRTRSTLRRNWQEARVLNGLVWMLVVAGVETAGDALACSTFGFWNAPAGARAWSAAIGTVQTAAISTSGNARSAIGTPHEAYPMKQARTSNRG